MDLNYARAVHEIAVRELRNFFMDLGLSDRMIKLALTLKNFDFSGLPQTLYQRYLTLKVKLIRARKIHIAAALN